MLRLKPAKWNISAAAETGEEALEAMRKQEGMAEERGVLAACCPCTTKNAGAWALASYIPVMFALFQHSLQMKLPGLESSEFMSMIAVTIRLKN